MQKSTKLLATTYDLYYDDTSRKPWSFILLDDGKALFRSYGYKTKAAAASVAVRKLNA